MSITSTRLGVAVAASMGLALTAMAQGEAVRPTDQVSRPTDFVGAEACATCHADQAERWQGSTHGRAGGPPSPETVVAPFDGTPIRFRDAEVIPSVDAEGRYVFQVRRPDRPEIRFEVAGVIGGGHMLGGGTQGFVSAFADGTQRFLPFDFSVTRGAWFCNTGHIAGWWIPGGGHADLRPDTGWIPITAEMKLTDCGDWPPVRVMGTDTRYGNCQQCHGSQIRLAFDSTAHRYRTSWSSLAVNCESCHGPGRAHVEWAEAAGSSGVAERPPDAGLGIAFPEDLGLDESLDVCFQCHALKRHLQGEHLSGRPVEESYSLGLPFLGDEPYYADGKVRTFAYQANHLYSACYFSGRMTCVDCHDPHSQGYRDVSRKPLQSPLDDGQCLGCHASKAEQPTLHTYHAEGSEGSRCVSCHMPYRQQPGVAGHIPYGRSDHSISIPRPGVDEALGTSSACALCHQDRSAEDLAAQTREWYGELAPQPPLVRAVAAARTVAEGEPLPRSLIEDLAGSSEPNPLLRMAALNELLGGYVRPDLGTEEAGVDAADAVVVGRLRALAASEAESADVVATALALLHVGWGDAMEVRAFLDGRRASLREEDGVLIRWARALQLIGDRWRSSGRVEWALRAFTRAQEVRPMDPSILLDLASAYTGMRRFEESLPYYVQTIRLDPTQSVAFVNLGLTLENLGREAEAEGAYLRAVQVNPAEAVAHMNLGNISLRRGAYAEAAESYEEALRHDPSMARAGFYLAVSLVGLEDLEGARRVLYAARDFAPDDPEIAELLGQVEALLR